MPQNGPSVARLKQEILDARTGHEWSFFNGTEHEDCLGVVRRVAVLSALIAQASGQTRGRI